MGCRVWCLFLSPDVDTRRDTTLSCTRAQGDTVAHTHLYIHIYTFYHLPMQQSVHKAANKRTMQLLDRRETHAQKEKVIYACPNVNQGNLLICQSGDLSFSFISPQATRLVLSASCAPRPLTILSALFAPLCPPHPPPLLPRTTSRSPGSLLHGLHVVHVPSPPSCLLLLFILEFRECFFFFLSFFFSCEASQLSKETLSPTRVSMSKCDPVMQFICPSIDPLIVNSTSPLVFSSPGSKLCQFIWVLVSMSFFLFLYVSFECAFFPLYFCHFSSI